MRTNINANNGQVDNIREKYDQLLQQCKMLQKENESLRTLLRSYGIYYEGNVAEQRRNCQYFSVYLPTQELDKCISI